MKHSNIFKLIATVVMAFAACTSAMAAAATAPKDPLGTWKDAAHCASPGKVISAKVSKKAKNGVLVNVKLKSGTVTNSTVDDAKVTDFPVGSAFCAQDYSGD